MFFCMGESEELDDTLKQIFFSSRNTKDHRGYLSGMLLCQM